jgi:hypothetical protein
LPENTVGKKRVERCEGLLPFLDGPMDKATAEEKEWVCQLEANSGAWHMLGRGRHSSVPPPSTYEDNVPLHLAYTMSR